MLTNIMYIYFFDVYMSFNLSNIYTSKNIISLREKIQSYCMACYFIDKLIFSFKETCFFWVNIKTITYKKRDRLDKFGWKY